jgi:C-terminal processing protease CtpA/Prc
MIRHILSLPLLVVLPAFAPAQQPAQQPAQPQLTQFELQRAHLMLRQAHDDIQKNYFDPAFHGVDIHKTFEQFNTRLDASKSINETYRVIAAYMLNLRDSHTFFQPPLRKNNSTPGFFMQMIGDKAFVTHIRPGTDAAAKLHVGDQVLALDGFKITLDQFHNIEYFIQDLSPAPTETLDILTPTGEQKKVVVNATLRTGKAIIDLTEGEGSADFWQLVRAGEEDDHLSRSRYFQVGDTAIWRLPSFEVDPMDVAKALSKVSKSKNLVIDLRGNLGGYSDTLKELLGHFFDHEVKLGDLVTRKDSKPEMIKPRNPYYAGKVTVLVDHDSASAAELFAKVIQLEHRGNVIGDRSAGAVMEANDYEEATGTDYKVFYGFSITAANILMTDGKSLENIGVTPDELLLPSADDLAAGKDPILAKAVTNDGDALDPADAGRHFPYEWPPL